MFNIVSNKLMKLGFVFTLFLPLFTLTVNAASPVVDVDWVKSHIGQKGIVFVDLRNLGAYKDGHVPGAVHANYIRDKWRVKINGVKGMLPPVEHLKKLIEKLGINNNSHVVLMPWGYNAAETGVATRVYWTMKVLGLNELSILNGGMMAYLKDKTAKLEKGVVTPAKSTFEVRFNKAVLATAKDVEEGLSSNVQFLDSRPTDQHIGINKSGAVVRTGTLPTAISVPGRWMTINDKGIFRSKSVLAKIYAAQKASTKGNTIVFCNTGHWASLGWFIDSEILGNKKSKMYDGSMAQWSRLPVATHPMVVKLNPN